MEFIGRLASKNTYNIGIISSASKNGSINFSYQFIHILNNKDRFNRLKGITKIQNRESRFKYQSNFYNVQSNNDVKHRGLKIQCNNKLFPSLNVTNGKSYTSGRKGVIRKYHYPSDPRLGTVIVSIRRIPCSCHDCTTISSLPFD